jgi:hypothetical protein
MSDITSPDQALYCPIFQVLIVVQPVGLYEVGDLLSVWIFLLKTLSGRIFSLMLIQREPACDRGTSYECLGTDFTSQSVLLIANI